jgi:predicted amidophosphoribosyltransferase
MFGVTSWALLWLATTAIIWRETKDERIARLKMLGINAVACPNCGYNLTGMTTTTCPECGSQYTLDQLYATLARTDEQIDQV